MYALTGLYLLFMSYWSLVVMIGNLIECVLCECVKLYKIHVDNVY
jgi:hypothetical protein